MFTKSKTALMQMKVSTAGRQIEVIVPDEKHTSRRAEGDKGEKTAAGNARAGRTVVTVMKTMTRDMQHNKGK